jgi:hypothetical protein
VRSLGSPRRGDWHVREERQPTRRLPFPTARNSQRTGGRPIAFVTVQREYCGGRSLFQALPLRRTASFLSRLSLRCALNLQAGCIGRSAAKCSAPSTPAKSMTTAGPPRIGNRCPSPHDRDSISANGAPPMAQPSPTPLPLGDPHEGLTNASLLSLVRGMTEDSQSWALAVG